jgi:hypothetical protein
VDFGTTWIEKALHLVSTNLHHAVKPTDLNITVLLVFYVRVTVHRNKFLYKKTNQMQFHPSPARKLSSNLYDIY